MKTFLIILLSQLTYSLEYDQSILCHDNIDIIDNKVSTEYLKIASVGFRCEDSYYLEEAKEQYNSLIDPNEPKIDGSVLGATISGPKDLVELAQELVQREPPEGTQELIKDCKSPLCVLRKVLGNEESAYRAANIKRLTNISVSATQYKVKDEVKPQTWHPGELREIEKSVLLLPEKMRKLNSFDYLRRVADGLQPARNIGSITYATAFPTIENNILGWDGEIKFYGEAFTESRYQAMHTILHEWFHQFSNSGCDKHDFNTEDKLQFSSGYHKLNDWIQEEKNGTDILGNPTVKKTWVSKKADGCYISEYAKTNPSEEFAEMMTAYILEPKSLKSKCPEHYNFIRDNFFDQKEYEDFQKSSIPYTQIVKCIEFREGNNFINGVGPEYTSSGGHSKKEHTFDLGRFIDVKKVNEDCIKEIESNLLNEQASQNKKDFCFKHGNKITEKLINSDLIKAYKSINWNKVEQSCKENKTRACADQVIIEEVSKNLPSELLSIVEHMPIATSSKKFSPAQFEKDYGFGTLLKCISSNGDYMKFDMDNDKISGRKSLQDNLSCKIDIRDSLKEDGYAPYETDTLKAVNEFLDIESNESYKALFLELKQKAKEIKKKKCKWSFVKNHCRGKILSSYIWKNKEKYGVKNKKDISNFDDLFHIIRKW